MRAEHRVQPRQNLPEPRLHFIAKRRRIRADRPFEIRILHADIVARAGIHETNGAHDIFHRVHFPGNKRLHVNHEMRRRDERVRPIVRLRGVRRFPFHVDIKTVGRRHQIARLQPDNAEGKLRPDVKAVNFGNIVQLAAFDEMPPAANRRFFLRRLKHELYRARDMFFERRKHRRRAEQNRHVAVVPARVHHALIFRRKGKSRLLRHRQRVHIRPKRHRPPRLSAFYDTQDRRLKKSRLKRNPQRRELFLDIFRRLDFFPRQLRMPMKMPPPFHDLGQYFFHGFPYHVFRHNINLLSPVNLCNDSFRNALDDNRCF